MASKYILQITDKSFCKDCNQPLYLLCHKDMPRRAIAFYICWPCKLVYQVGVGPVEWEKLVRWE